jgi:hypothetical protein
MAMLAATAEASKIGEIPLKAANKAKKGKHLAI